MAGIQKLGGGIGPKQKVLSETEREEVLDNGEERGASLKWSSWRVTL